MRTGRAGIRRLSPFVNVSAVSANPSDRLRPLEHNPVGYVFGQRNVTLLMSLLRNGNAFENIRYHGESFLFRGLGKFRVHNRIFIVLAARRFLEVFQRAAYYYRQETPL